VTGAARADIEKHKETAAMVRMPVTKLQKAERKTHFLA
jgi:hypothetical protein